MKECKRCKQSLSSDNFYKHSATPDRLSYYCKKCAIKNTNESTAKRKLQIAADILAGNTPQKDHEGGKKSPNQYKAEDIYKALRAVRAFRADINKRDIVKITYKALEAAISIEYDAKLNTKTVAKYNRGEVKKDLIKMIKSGNAAAAQRLIELEGMNSRADDFVIVPLIFNEASKTSSEELYERYLKENPNPDE